MHGRIGLIATLVLGLVFLGAFVVHPLIRWTYDFEIDYNEGWNAYHQSAAARGNPYAHGERYVILNYTPVSFYLVGALTRFGDPVFIGRFLSILAFAAVVVLTGLIARRLGASTLDAAFASVMCMGLIGAFHGGYIGVDDPQLLATAFVLAGVLAYASSESKPWRIAIALLLFLVAGLIKQTMFIAPVAAAIDLLLRNRRRGLYFCAGGALLGAAAVAALYLVLGSVALQQILWPRVYSLHLGASKTFAFLKELGGAIPAALLLLLVLVRSGRNRFVLLYLLVGLISGALMSGGVGAGSNAFVDVTVGLSLAAALVLRTLRDDLRTPSPVMAAFAAMCAYTPGLEVPYALERLRDGVSGSFSAAQSAFRRDVAFVREHPGEAFCHSPLLSFRAGRRFFVDPFNASQAIKLGRTDPAPLLADLAQGNVAVLQLSTLEGAHAMGPPSRGGPDVQREFDSLLKQRYRLARTGYKQVFYVPR